MSVKHRTFVLKREDLFLVRFVYDARADGSVAAPGFEASPRIEDAARFYRTDAHLIAALLPSSAGKSFEPVETDPEER